MTARASTSVDYEIVIGLEIHAELLTDSKVFCGCPTEFGGEPNTRCCPICLGLPGVLPVLNRKAVEHAIKVGLALNCEIAGFSKFDRKNYFYPDLPKAYQISQYDLPIAVKGSVQVPMPDGGEKRVGIVRVHLEEETGKSIHSGESIVTSESSLIDYNRVGIPLLEIVTEPDIRSPEEARLFLETLRTILLYTGVSDCKMEEGSLRCDANISLRPRGSTEFGTKTEIKNMNSFRSVQRALEFEAERQKNLLLAGEKVIQETRHWDESRGMTVSMRSKEQAHDYRYFPEPDLVPLVIDREWVDRIRAEMPELPTARRARFMEEYRIPRYDAALLTSTRAMADYFEEAARLSKDPKSAANWIMGDLSRLLNLEGLSIEESPVSPGMLAELIGLVNDGTISGKIAKTVFEEMFATQKSPAEIVREKGLIQITDEAQLESIVEKVLAANPETVESYRNGKTKAIGFLVGQVMKETRGRANPQLVNELLTRKLSE